MVIKSILASRIPSQKPLNVKRLGDYVDKIAKIELAELLDILESSGSDYGV